MQHYILKRVLQAIPILIGISMISFLIVALAPGDPVANMYPPYQLKHIDQALVRHQLELDQPIPLQYLNMVKKLVTGDLKSFAERRPVLDMIRDAMPTTLALASLTILLSVILAIPIALISAANKHSWIDGLFNVGSLFGISVPSFWLALVAVLLLSERLHLLPSGGLQSIGATSYSLVDIIPHLIMPVGILTLITSPGLIRYARSSMMDVMLEDYIRTARAKGLKESGVVLKHGLKNALIPFVAEIGLDIPWLFGGTVVIETIFALPGLGRLAVQSAIARDYPVILTINLYVALLTILSGILTDIAYSVLDPGSDKVDAIMSDATFDMPPELAGRASRNNTALALRRYARNRLAVVGSVVILIFLAMALAAPIVAPFQPDKQVIVDRLKPPSAQYLMGTDALGRDVFSRAVWASRVSMPIGFLAMAISLVVGILVGLVAGFYGGWIDNALMRFTDLILSFPIIFLLLTIAALFGPSVKTIIWMLGLTSWGETARLMRGQALALRDTEYVEAARAIGAKDSRIIFHHILRNSLSVITVNATLMVAYAILIEGSSELSGIRRTTSHAKLGEYDGGRKRRAAHRLVGQRVPRHLPLAGGHFVQPAGRGVEGYVRSFQTKSITKQGVLGMANTTSTAERPAITITPERGLVDQKLAIRARGFRPGQMVTVRARTFSATHQELAAWATLQADPGGCIDLGEQKPSAGSYDWADPMGLIWTLEPVVDADKPRRPTTFDLSPMQIEFEAEIDGKVVASKTVQRLWMADGVERSVLHEQGLRGIFFLPPGTGPFPAIIVVTGSGGGLNANRAAQFASHGYAALALAYFAYEDLPTGLFEIPLEYFETAIQWLQANPKVDGERLAVTGGSRGGELSLVLGSTFPQFKAVIPYVPSSVSWGGVGVEGNPDRPAWTYRGKAIPYITHKPSEEVEVEDPSKPIPLTPAFLEAMQKEEALRAATIPVEKINGPVLLISGEDDQMWPSTLFSRLVMQRLEQQRFKFPYQHLSYPGTGHSIGTPYIPLNPSHAIHPVDGRDYAYGGNPKDQSFAHADSWEKVLDLLEKHL